MKQLIAANWKMNKTSKQAVSFLKKIKLSKKRDALICAPFTLLASLKNRRVPIGAQNMYHKEQGAYTGEVSAAMVKEYADYVILGHSERRLYLKETDEFINQKMHQARKHKLIPILCIGETQKERNRGLTKTVLKRQLQIGLKDVKGSFIIAYEPVWAISTFQTSKIKQTASLRDVKQIHTFIRSQLKRLYSDAKARQTRILYGGSVNPTNVKELMAVPNVDGALVGGASLEVSSYNTLLNFD